MGQNHRPPFRLSLPYRILPLGALLLGAMTVTPASAQMSHAQHGDHAAMAGTGAAGLPTEPGQGAFATIAEIVALLRADPQTDWSRVNLTALREHLVDMNLVTLQARVARERRPGGMIFTVTGTGRVAQAVRGMVPAHAPFIAQETGWTVRARLLDNGAELEVIGDEAQIRALGLFGLMTLGAHHQAHHLAIARGEAPH